MAVHWERWVQWRHNLTEGENRWTGRHGEKGGWGGWSPAPVVYGKMHRKLFKKSQSIPRRLLLSSRPQREGSTGGQMKAETLGVGWGVPCSFLPLGDEPSLGRGDIAHHLAADRDCVAMIMWEGPLSGRCWPIPASTDMAMASAAALELRPLCPAEGLGAKELCWITGAGEPVGSDVSFMLSSAATKNKDVYRFSI